MVSEAGRLRRPRRLMDLPHLPVHKGGRMDPDEVHHFWRSLEQWGELLEEIAAGGCCTSIFSGLGQGSFGALGDDTVQVHCPAPASGTSGFPYPTDTGTDVIGPGNWHINGNVWINYSAVVSGGKDEVEAHWYPGVGTSSGANGIIYGEVAEVPLGTDKVVIPFSGNIHIEEGGSMEPTIEVLVNHGLGTAHSGICTVYYHAIGSCACATSITEAGG